VPLRSEGLKFLLYGAAVDIVHKMSGKIVTMGDGPGDAYFRLANAPREGIFKIISNSKKKRNDRVCSLWALILIYLSDCCWTRALVVVSLLLLFLTFS
jgi:hypothetical protein